MRRRRTVLQRILLGCLLLSRLLLIVWQWSQEDVFCNLNPKMNTNHWWTPMPREKDASRDFQQPIATGWSGIGAGGCCVEPVTWTAREDACLSHWDYCGGGVIFVSQPERIVYNGVPVWLVHVSCACNQVNRASPSQPAYFCRSIPARSLIVATLCHG